MDLPPPDTAITAAALDFPSVAPKAGAARQGFLSNLASLLMGQAGCALLSIAAEICYARLLGPVGRGQISLCMMAITFGALLGGLGGEIPIVVWTADSRRRTSEWFPAVLLCGAVGCLIVCGAWVLVYRNCRPVFLNGITWGLTLLVLVGIPITVFDGYLTALLTGLERFRLRAGLSLVEQFVALVSFVALAILIGRRAEAAMLGVLAGLVGAAILTGALIRNSLGGNWKFAPTVQKVGAALSLGVRGQFGNLASFFNYRLDVFVVNYFLTPAQVGLYAVGVVVSEAVWQIPQAVATALTPRTVRTIENGATEFTCTVMRQVLIIATVSGLGLAVACQLVVPLLFGAGFEPSVPVIWWILPGTIALSLGKVASADFAARSRPQFNAIFSIAALVATIILDFALIPRMGIDGAALASSGAYFLNSVLLIATLKRQLGVTWNALIVPRRADLDSYRRAFLIFKSRYESLRKRLKQLGSSVGDQRTG